MEEKAKEREGGERCSIARRKSIHREKIWSVRPFKIKALRPAGSLFKQSIP